MRNSLLLLRMAVVTTKAHGCDQSLVGFAAAIGVGAAAVADELLHVHSARRSTSRQVSILDSACANL